MTLNDSKQMHSLVSFFQDRVQDKTGKRPAVNRNKVKYLIFDMLQDITIERAKEIIQAYVLRSHDPDLSKFCYNYDEFGRDLDAEKEDLNRRKELLEQTRLRVEKYRQENQ